MGMRSVAKSKLSLRSPVSRALIEFMDGKTRWTGTAADLNTALYRIHAIGGRLERHDDRPGRAVAGGAAHLQPPVAGLLRGCY